MQKITDIEKANKMLNEAELVIGDLMSEIETFLPERYSSSELVAAGNDLLSIMDGQKDYGDCPNCSKEMIEDGKLNEDGTTINLVKSCPNCGYAEPLNK